MTIKEWINHVGRSKEYKVIGGVCGGLGIATGIPVWIWRLCFLILGFCGSGILLYLLLWWLLPYHRFDRAQADALSQQTTSFYRLKSDRWIGGICVAMAAQTGYPAWIFRLSWVILALLNGIGLVIYIMLWIVLPLYPRE